MTNQAQRSARIVGLLFLVAMVTALVGAGLIEAGLGASDYLSGAAANEGQVIAGVILELINGAAVIGIAFMMFPILKKVNEALGLGYVAFRIVEVVIIVAAVIGPLTLVALGRQVATAGAADAAAFAALGTGIVAVRVILAGQLLGIFFSLGAFLFYSLLYRARLVPRFISVWGLIATAAVFSWNFLELAGYRIDAGIVFGLPIILNEIFLGIWLIAKGFNAAAVFPELAQAAVKTA